MGDSQNNQVGFDFSGALQDRIDRIARCDLKTRLAPQGRIFWHKLFHSLPVAKHRSLFTVFRNVQKREIPVGLLGQGNCVLRGPK